MENLVEGFQKIHDNYIIVNQRVNYQIKNHGKPTRQTTTSRPFSTRPTGSEFIASGMAG
jgi:hypothetical protein